MGWVVSVLPRPRFTPGERTPGTHCTGGWVGPRAGLDTEGRGKILCPCRGLNPDRQVVQPIVRHYTAWAIPAPNLEHVQNTNSIKKSHTLHVPSLHTNRFILAYLRIRNITVIRGTNQTMIYILLLIIKTINCWRLKSVLMTTTLIMTVMLSPSFCDRIP
jgi:hypothetical protein